MVKTALYTSCRMTFITVQAGIYITADSVMLAVHIRLIVGMAIDTTKIFETAGIRVAFGAGRPCSGVFA